VAGAGNDEVQNVSACAVLGIDPGSRVAGYALARFEGTDVVDCELGVWSPGRSRGRAAALAQLAAEAEAWLAQRRPEVAAVEGLFHHRNVRSALALAEARGVLLSVLGRLGVEVVEYPPATVKKTLCGNGGASKESVRRALGLTVSGLRGVRLDRHPADATDALALAVCHAVHSRFATRTGWRR
jgi:crossover junction endodeoxyribonuclease RuvC